MCTVAAGCGSKDWSSEPLSETVSGKTHKDVAYSVSLPADLEPGHRDGVWKKGRELEISIGQTFLPVLDLAAAERDAVEEARDDEGIVKKEVSGDRFLFWGAAADNESMWHASYIPALDDSDLRCSVRVHAGSEIADPDKLQQWMTSVCASVKLENPKKREPLPPALLEFLAALDGNHEHVSAAIKKLADPAMASNGDIGMYDLEQPELNYENKRDIGRCFNIDAKAGMTKRDFDICFTPAGKIAAIADNGIKK